MLQNVVVAAWRMCSRGQEFLGDSGLVWVRQHRGWADVKEP